MPLPRPPLCKDSGTGLPRGLAPRRWREAHSTEDEGRMTTPNRELLDKIAAEPDYVENTHDVDLP
jgi:hypothetical protein